MATGLMFWGLMGQVTWLAELSWYWKVLIGLGKGHRPMARRRCNNGRVKRKNGLKIENLGSLEQKRVDNGEILKKCSIIDDYLKSIQYLDWLVQGERAARRSWSRMGTEGHQDGRAGYDV